MIPSRTRTGCFTAPRCTGSKASTRRSLASLRPTSLGSGPIGECVQVVGPPLGASRGREVAILGLGAGTLASYAEPDERWTFYEIDPVIARIAGDRRFFTYLTDCRAKALKIVLGDARLRLREAPDHAFGLIVLDAFSSDSLPVHLLSREAIRLYRSKLAAEGRAGIQLIESVPGPGTRARPASASTPAWSAGLRTTSTSVPSKRGWQTAVDLGGDGREPRRPSRIWWTIPAGRLPRLHANSAVWTDDFSDLASYIRWWPLPRKKADHRAAREIDLKAAMSLESPATAGRRSGPSRSRDVEPVTAALL